MVGNALIVLVFNFLLHTHIHTYTQMVENALTALIFNALFIGFITLVPFTLGRVVLSVSACMYVCIHVMCLRMYACMYVHTYIHTFWIHYFGSLHPRSRGLICKCMYVCMYSWYVSTYVCMYVYTYIHTYILDSLLWFPSLLVAWSYL